MFDNSFIINFLKKYNLKISTCESASCGMLCAELGNIPGISSVYKGSIICYDKEIKTNILNISNDLINKYGTISKECAFYMANNCNQLLQTDICIAITGNAGPSCIENKPEGLFYVAIAIIDQIITFEVKLDYKDRNKNRIAIVNKSLTLLEEFIKDFLIKK